MHGLLATPSPESPLERSLTPNWVEDANNLHARVHMRELELSLEGRTIAESRRAMARALVLQTIRNARRARSSYSPDSPEHETPSDDRAPSSG